MIRVCVHHGVANNFLKILCHTFAVLKTIYSEGIDLQERDKLRTEDGGIIHRCLNEEPGAFGLLVDKYKAGIYAYVYTRLLHFQDAQDVTQEVFLQAYRDLRTLRRWESFVFWLYRIAHNCCAKCLQARSRRPDQDFIEDQDPEVIDAPSLNSYRDNQVNGSLQEAIYSLPETYRQVVMLYYFGGMNTGEIAKALGTSPTTIRKRLSRARSQLKEEMVAMIGTGFEGHRLEASFTFRVVEAVRRIKINPVPRMAGLPWGISLAAGIIITVLSLNPRLNLLDPTLASMSSALPGESKVLETGQISAEIVKIARIPAIASKGEDGRGETLKPSEQQKPFHRAPADQGGTWEEKADMPTARSEFGLSSANGRIYVFGGSNVGMVTIPTVEEYDPETNTWTTKGGMSVPRRNFSTSVVNGKIYAIGGQAHTSTGLSTVEEYDPVTDKWKRKSDMPTPRTLVSTSVVNGKIYATGGMRNSSDIQALSAVEEYDPVTDKWKRKDDMPVAEYYHSTSVVNGKIYAIFYTGTVEEYDPATDTWTKKANMPTPRVCYTSAVNGRIYAIGGCPPGPLPRDPHLSTVEEYTPATDTWTKKADMPTPRTCYTSAVNGKIYAIGGFDGNKAISTVEEYDPGYVSVEAKGKLLTTWGETRSR